MKVIDLSIGFCTVKKNTRLFQRCWRAIILYDTVHGLFSLLL